MNQIRIIAQVLAANPVLASPKKELQEILGVRPTNAAGGVEFDSKYLGIWQLSGNVLRIGPRGKVLKLDAWDKLYDELQDWYKSTRQAKVKQALDHAILTVEALLDEE